MRQVSSLGACRRPSCRGADCACACGSGRWRLREQGRAGQLLFKGGAGVAIVVAAMSRNYNDELQFLEKIDKNSWRIKKGFVPNMQVRRGAGAGGGAQGLGARDASPPPARPPASPPDPSRAPGPPSPQQSSSHTALGDCLACAGPVSPRAVPISRDRQSDVCLGNPSK